MQNSIYNLGLTIERSLTNVVKQRLLIDDHEIVYLERSGPGETIILVHGFAANKDNWLRFIRFLPKDYRIIALDLPGHGNSTRLDPGVYTSEFLISCFAQWLEQLAIDRFHLVGNSLGGYIATRYAARHTHRLISLGLLAPAGVYPPIPSEMQAALEKGRNPILVKTIEDYYALLEFSFVKKPFLPWPVHSVNAKQYVAAGDFNEKMFDQLWTNREDVVEDLPSLRNTPTLFIWGDQDKVLHVSSLSVYQVYLPQAQAVVMSDCGHAPMLERPKETAHHYSQFLAKLAAPELLWEPK